MEKLFVLKLIENFKRLSGIQSSNEISEELVKLERTVERLNSAKNVHLLRTDYLE